MAFRTILILIGSLVMGVPSFAVAHQVNLVAYVQGEVCYVEAYFSKARRAQNAKVEVFDLEGNRLLEGETDTEGNFSFKRPKRADLMILLTTDMGHQSTFTIRTNEMEEEVPQDQTPYPMEKGRDLPVDAITLQRVLDETLDRKLKPFAQRIAELERGRGVTLQEVIAGIGYILGIFGGAQLLAGRKKER